MALYRKIFPLSVPVCYWHSFSFRLWKRVHFQVQRLSKNAWGGGTKCPISPPLASTVLLPDSLYVNSLMLWAMWQMRDPALKLSPCSPQMCKLHFHVLFLKQDVACWQLVVALKSPKTAAQFQVDQNICKDMFPLHM